MTTLHTTNVYNVRASLNKWLSDTLAAFTLPSHLPAVNVVFAMPETGIEPPAVSVAHHDVMAADLFQGRYVGTGPGLRQYALMDISCWTSRSNVHWLAQLNTLCALITQAWVSQAVLVLSDYSTPGSPATVEYKVNLRDLEYVETSHDSNPDIERSRYLGRYDWIVRS